MPGLAITVDDRAVAQATREGALESVRTFA